MRVIQVGYGSFGWSWSPLVRDAEGVELAAVVDADAAARERAADALGPSVPIRASLAAAFSGTEADAVLVVTPPPTHRAVGEAALAAGMHVLLEKPLATTLDDGRALVAAAERAGRVLMVSQNYRHRAPARAAQAVVAGGELGELAAVSIRFRRDTRRLWAAEDFRYAMRHPLVLDMSIHHADLLRALTGREVRQIFARDWRVPDSPYVHHPAVVAVMALEGGATVTYEGDWATREAETSWNGDWEIVGERGRLRWTGGEADATVGEVTLERWGEAPRPVPQPTLAEVDRRGTLRAFRRAVEGGGEPETSGRDNLGSLAIVLGCVASIERGEAVAVEGRQ